MRTVKVIGNPGTGKTKYLVDHTAELIKSGVEPDEIAYLTFTRKAAQEAMERLTQLTGLPKDSFRWVRTLHSMAFEILGTKKEQMITDDDLKGFLFEAGVLDEETGKKMIQIHSYSRIARIPLMEAWERMKGTIAVPWPTLFRFADHYKRFKEHMGKYDFHDLLIYYLANPVIPSLHTVIVDEAQDLSAAQWEMIKVLSANAQVLMLAGDPHQAIYNWCGADSNILMNLDGEEIILPQSFRIPRKVQEVSTLVLARFSDPHRYPYLPADHPGTCKVLSQLNLHQLDLKNGSWMFLSRNECFLNDIRHFLFNSGVPFESRGSWGKNTEDDKKLRWITWYEDWVKTGDEPTPGKLDKLKTVSTNIFKYVATDTPWHEAFDTWSIKERKFLISMRSEEPSNIVLSTIHGAKGGEADNVVILGDYTAAVDVSMNNSNKAQEFACLYVGVTRAKKNLILVQPQRRFGYNWKEYTP